MEIADELSHADPIRLSLLLNYAVYQYEMAESEGTEAKEAAIKLAKESIQKAEDELETLDNQKAGESTFILGFLRENLNIWRNKIKKVSSSKKNLFSQQDSEAQFINHDVDDEEEGEEEVSYQDVEEASWGDKVGR